MSFFGITVEEISELRPHSNADRLSVASLKGVGFQFIVGKDTWKVGDKCLYFPLDAILPDPILKALNVEGRLAGAKKNRIKTIKLRGEISQGLIGPLSLIEKLPENERTPENITRFLGITKYEPEIELPCSHDARLMELPEGVGIYDIENCERFPDAVKYLMEQPVWISEKLEGSHYALAIIDDKPWVCQRRFALEPLPDKPKHFFLEVTENENLIDLAKDIAKELATNHLVLRGEILGPNIQNNIYRLTQRSVKFFDILLNGKYLNASDVICHFSKREKEHLVVPTISINKTLKEWLSGKPLPQASNGESLLHKTPREGIVIRPMQEQYHEEIKSRLILKQISPEYLAL